MADYPMQQGDMRTTGFEQIIQEMHTRMQEQDRIIQSLQGQVASAANAQSQQPPRSAPQAEIQQLTEVIRATLQNQQQDAERRTKAIAENPTAFDGKDRVKYAAFRHKLRTKMGIDHGFWRNDYERVNHMFSCLTGAAETALRPWIETHAASIESTTPSAPADFLKKLDELFLDNELQTRAFAKLTTLRQRGSAFEDYLALFQRYLMESGEITLSDRAKKSHLRNGLNDELRQVLVGVEEKDGFDDYCR